MNTPRNSVASSPDDDPTGVRALLSSLPEPEPMPAYLVERISASLAAEQAQRADSFSGVSVTPMHPTRRRRAGRLMFAMAGAAAAVALIGVVGNNLMRPALTSTASGSSASAVTSDGRAAEGAMSPTANDKAAGGPSAPSVDVVQVSDRRYTLAGFATQAQGLRFARADATRDETTYSAQAGRIGTTAGLQECLAAIGAGGAQIVKADVAFYEGKPAVIIVATTNGIHEAYAVGRDCSRADAAVLHPAIALP